MAASPTTLSTATEPSKTKQLSQWVADMEFESIPDEVITRAKHILLDGIACALVGARLPWSAKATQAVFAMDPPGDCTVTGWEHKLPPLSAALLNGTYIQGFELDDWHSEAPLHSNSILIPALLAATESLSAKNQEVRISGKDFLLGLVVGYEIGPRVGRALHGPHILTTGWHSGAVFGPAASAGAVSSLMHLQPDTIEDAFGIACTQACGLMSAQFGSDAKRMHHGFAARNGLFAALLAQNGYTGIKDVFEQTYGGFLKQFSLGNGKEPAYLPSELVEGLGKQWKTMGVNLKPYASMAATHAPVDCARLLQEHSPEMSKDLKSIKKITIKMAEASFHHGGWKATRPLSALGAQMSSAWAFATQLVHGHVLPAQYRAEELENDDTWRLVNRTDCVEDDEFANIAGSAVTVEFEDGTTLTESVKAARGVDPPMSNEELVEKYRLLTKDVADEERVERIEKLVLGLDSCEDVTELGALLGKSTENPIA